ncbi:hypothetical protein AB0L00_17340 [Actinoallomurus sp. NPDC052308]|uniref:hypothetical protein n=1 Tax=Actinoallomurus sp. NPDC052308 TaxID=3155530 RepID=UPI0034273F10
MKARINRSAAVAGALAALVGAAPAASAASTPVTTKAASTWQRYDVPVRGRANVVSVAATGRDSAWAGGFQVGDGTGLASRDHVGPADSEDVAHVRSTADDCYEATAFPSLMLRWDGRTWRQAPVPDLGRIEHVSASGPEDAWASADCGLLHWDGRGWSTVPFAPTGAQQTATGAVKAVGPDEAWMVGGTYDNQTGVEHGIVQRWDGDQWHDVPLPGLGDHFALKGVDARGSNDVWVAGTDYTDDDQRPERLLLLHWDGGSWKRLPEPATDEWTKRVQTVRVLSTGDVWVGGWTKSTFSGDAIRNPLLMHWNGRAWASTPTPAGPGEVADLSADLSADRRRLTAVGDTFSPGVSEYAMSVLRWTGERWTADGVPATGTASLFGAAAVPGGGTWVTGAVGDADTMRPLIARRG